ncbi:hypothetical protein ElyMa_006931100 [Elysia marginata]|uniref:Uncharacterized protein n=1 Tax=Elysia marginata TaxID=1093978 RepID=A0AAV4JFY3_9GAST|nr:hypothetical protein ElyMa_006931100 [Elysia marginata]
MNISFSEQTAETFEYPNEESALKAYLEEHPNDTEDDDVLFMDTSGGSFGESSDDKDDDDENNSSEKDALPTTPRGGGGGDEELLKSNTSLSSSGNLQSYRGRYQEDFVWPAHPEPEPVKQPIVEPEPEDPDSMMLRPAEEEDMNTWSTSDVADILF